MPGLQVLLPLMILKEDHASVLEGFALEDFFDILFPLLDQLLLLIQIY